ncbi:MAG TPA: hypothetical protein VHN36_17240 [Ilumatobacteraceae bacterium]|nr:hypothetical protein [Ilumatobacteraceae bacterium]
MIIDPSVEAGLAVPDRDYEFMVLDLLKYHGKQEGVILESYRRVAEESTAGEAVQYLVRLILADEERHHRQFAEMANEILSVVSELPVEPCLPSIDTRSDPDLLAETKRLLAFERADAKELRRLRKTLRHGSRASLSPLFADLMLHDTAKHIAILEFIKEHLTR